MISKINIGLIMFIFVMLILISYFPNTQPFSPFNNGWNGISSLYKNSSGLITSSSMLNFNGVLVIVNPEKMPTNKDIQNLNNFLKNGNEIIIFGDGNLVNGLIKLLGGNIITNNEIVYDDIFNYKSNIFPLALTNNKEKLVLFYTSYLNNGTPIANTSFFSYIKNGSNLIYGPFTVSSEEYINKGKIIVISDPYFILNYVFNLGNNQKFFFNLTNGEKYYIATFLQNETPYLFLKIQINNLSKFISQLYMQIILLSTFFIASIFVYSLKEEAKVNNSYNINKIMKEHPDWDKNLINEILEEKNNESK